MIICYESDGLLNTFFCTLLLSPFLLPIFLSFPAKSSSSRLCFRFCSFFTPPTLLSFRKFPFRFLFFGRENGQPAIFFGGCRIWQVESADERRVTPAGQAAWNIVRWRSDKGWKMTTTYGWSRQHETDIRSILVQDSRKWVPSIRNSLV